MFVRNFYSLSLYILWQSFSELIIAVLKSIAGFMAGVFVTLFVLIFAISDSCYELSKFVKRQLCELYHVCMRHRVVAALISIIIVLSMIVIFCIIDIYHLRAKQDYVELQMVQVSHMNDSLRHAEIKYRR